jgi:signal transduction histidine kinase
MREIALAQWAHDIRNALGTVALYVETLERPDPQSRKAVARTHALLAQAAAMCNAAVKQAGEGPDAACRSGFNVVQTIRQIRELVAPTLPRGASLQVVADDPIYVMADAQEVFRILFNLVHNAASIARRGDALRRIRITASHNGSAAVITVVDDGPGLPETVRARLFRRGQSATGSSGYGLAIARELAERNGVVLELGRADQGTVFVVELPLHTVSTDHVAALYRAREQLPPQFA